MIETKNEIKSVVVALSNVGTISVGKKFAQELDEKLQEYFLVIQA